MHQSVFHKTWPGLNVVVSHQLIPCASDQGSRDYLCPRLSRYLPFSYGHKGQNGAAILGGKMALTGQTVSSPDGCSGRNYFKLTVYSGIRKLQPLKGSVWILDVDLNTGEEKFKYILTSKRNHVGAVSDSKRPTLSTSS